ncbi:hypothetical protein MMAN_54860 [Mycobacterium mantenii]|uniref:DUF732 domain-containing protein n=1 Tax=Mycobacterium mantenii TaxID=560555 RepID=A0A1X0FSK5_MYCNT|nr:hypothetical protein BST30_16360 [Mycobacterium mantenii]BBY41352.1 hypothetical protein MMAN_54860 [Mycobacterium mantenii]
MAGIAFAAPAHADDADFIQFLTEHGLGCGEGSIKCKSADDLIQLGHSVCYDIDVNGQTPVRAADKAVEIGEGWINREQAADLVAASIVNYCPWDKAQVSGGTGDGDT